MKILPKPIRSLLHPQTPVIALLVAKPIPLPRAYTYLVTAHGVPPQRAQMLLRK